MARYKQRLNFCLKLSALGVQAQVLSDAEADARMGGISHSSDSIPVMFFGTLEIAWMKKGDICPWGKGMADMLYERGRTRKSFLQAGEEVRAKEIICVALCNMFVCTPWDSIWEPLIEQGC